MSARVEPLEVVEADHDLLPLGELLDRAGEQLAGLAVLGHRLRVQGAGVLQRVAEAGRAAAVVVGEQLVEGDDVDQGQLAEELAHLLDVHVQHLGDLFVGRRALQLGLELGDGALERRAFMRTDRGIQSVLRSSSMIAPRMRAIA